MKSLSLILFLTFFFFLSNNIFPSTSDTVHISHYSIYLTDINTQTHTLKAYAQLTVISKMNNINGFSLELKTLTVDSVFVNEIPATFINNNDLVSVLLEQPLNAGDTLSVKVCYHGSPFHESWGGFHWNGSYAFNLGVGFESIPHNLGKAWFPCIDNFTDRASYDVFVRLESEKKAVCGGDLVNVVDNEDGTLTYHWKLSQNIPTYLASVAVGDYIVVEDKYYGIEDTIPIKVYVRPVDSSKVQGTFINLKTTMAFFEDRFGPYPFDRIGYVGTSIGAMEHATNIAYPNFAIDGTTNYESLYTHELSHMWFGDKITCDKAEEMWINEGWASFCEMYYLEAYGQHDLFIKQMRERNAKVLQNTAVIDGGDYALANVPQNVTYGSTSYDKGAVVVNSLRGYLGDSLFSAGVKGALSQIGFKSVNSMEWLNAIGENAGVDLQDFLDLWVYTPGTPHFAIDSTEISTYGDKYEVDIYLRQKHKGNNFIGNDIVTEIGFLKDDFTIVTDTVHFSGKRGCSVKLVDFEPLLTMIDPLEKINDATIDYFKVFTEPIQYSFQKTYFKLYIDELDDEAFVRVTHHWIYPDSIKMPVDGLRITNTRYWEIEGVFPESMSARGKFYFSDSETMDENLGLTMNDSVMLLYRSGTNDDWHYVPQYLYGIPTIGYIFVYDLKPGQYVVAAIDKQLVNITEEATGKAVVYPNPTTGKISLKLQDKDDYQVIVTDTSGKTVQKFSFTGKRRTLSLSSAPGLYVITVFKHGNYFASEKIILNK
jgi:aminopeptidase N